MIYSYLDSELRATLAVIGCMSVFIIVSFFTTSFPWFAFLPLLAISAYAIAVYPRAGLFATILLTMVWERFFTLQSLVIDGRMIKVYPVDFLLVITAIAACTHWYIEYRRRRLFHHPHAEAPAFLAIFGRFEKWLLLFCALATAYFFESQLAGVHEPTIAFSTFKNYAFYPLLTFLVLALIRTPHDLKRLLHVVLTGGAAVLVFLVIGFIRGEGLWTEFTPLSTEGIRYVAFPHALALMIALLIGINALLARALPTTRLSIIVLALQFIGLLASLMRHLWIAFLIGIVVIVLVAPARIRRSVLVFGQWAAAATLGIGIIIVALALFLPETSVGVFASRFLDPLVSRVLSFRHIGDDLSALWRIQLWKETFSAFAAQPIFGLGFGREITFDVRGWVSTVRLRDLHNSLFGVLVQTGVFGFLIFASFNVILVRDYLKRRVSLGSLLPWADGLFAAYGAYVVASLFQPYLETNILGIFFWVLVGALRVSTFVKHEPILDRSKLALQRGLKQLIGIHDRGK